MGLAILELLLAGQLAAQVIPSLEPNQRVKLWFGHPEEADGLVGYLVLFEPRRVGVVPVGRARTEIFRFADVSRFEVSIGQSPVARNGAVLIGTATGFWLGASGRLEESRCRVAGWNDPSCRWVTPPAVVGAGGGLILTALASGFLLPERWREVAVGGVGGTSGAAGGVGLSMGLRFRF